MRFHSRGKLTAFEFFAIVIWKANRAKSRVADSLLKASGEADLEDAVSALTSKLAVAVDDPDRLKILLSHGLMLPMASAILAVLWPNSFSVYDVRVRGELSIHEDLSACRDFSKVWTGYCQYIDAVRREIREPLCLRDKDRVLWARAVMKQLRNDIGRRFSKDCPS